MPDVLLGLGAAVVKTATKLWLKKDPFAAEMSGPVIDTITGKLTNVRDQRRAKRLFEQFEETVAEKLEISLGPELSGLPPHERDAAVLAVTDTFERAALTDDDLFAADLDALYLEKQIRTSSPQATRDLAESAQALYDLMLPRCCSYVIEVKLALPAFGPGALKEILHRETQILAGIQELLERVPQAAQNDPDEAFRAIYRRQVVASLDHLELFGVTLSDTIRRYPLSVAYISLELSVPSESADEPARLSFAETREGRLWWTANDDQKVVFSVRQEAVGALEFRSVQALFALFTRRLFLRGEAGSGKTTLLQWLAVQLSGGGQNRDLLRLKDTRRDVAFFIPLRQYVGRELPAPVEFVAKVGRHIADEMPVGWVQRQLRSGRAAVLVDGVDELPAEERENAKAWLAELIATFPEAQYVVTSRPTAVSQEWLAAEAFDGADLMPMSWPDIATFVEHWHKALRSTGHHDSDALHAYEASLLEKLRARRHLRALATNPLLCALICALHYDRKMQLPRDRMELYAIALDMLLERRDSERKIADSDNPEMSRTDKTFILQSFAYWLIRNGRSDASYADTVAEVRRCLAQMPRVTAAPEAVLRHLLVRSGLLRMPVADRVDFVHRTFQEYLAAKAAIEANDIGNLIKNADDDQWREVIILAAGHAQPHQRTELLRGLLARADKEAELRNPLRLLAVACLETCAQLDSELERDIKQVARSLLPPRSFDAAQSLAKSGELVLDLLSDYPPGTPGQAASTIRAAAVIGGDNALRIITRCAQYDDPVVNQELERAWPQFDPIVFAATVLRPSPHGRAARAINDPALMPALRELPELTELVCSIPGGYGDLSFVEGLPNLEVLRILDDTRLARLDPLRAATRLRWLDLPPTEADLTPLADLPHLQVLSLRSAFAYDPAPLHRCTALEHLTLGDPGDLSRVADYVPPDQLRRLELISVRGQIDLADLAEARLDGLERLSLSFCNLYRIDGIQRWASSLRMLSLSNTQVADVEPLRGFDRLQVLHLRSTQVSDLTPLEGLTELGELRLDEISTPFDLNPLKALRKLRRLSLRGDQPVDLRPLADMRDLLVEVRPGQKAIGASFLGAGSRLERVG